MYTKYYFIFIGIWLAATERIFPLPVAPDSSNIRCTHHFYYKPVCGTDGKTYINDGHLACVAEKKPGLKTRHNGLCAPVIVLPKSGYTKSYSLQPRELQ